MDPAFLTPLGIALMWLRLERRLTYLEREVRDLPCQDPNRPVNKAEGCWWSLWRPSPRKITDSPPP